MLLIGISPRPPLGRSSRLLRPALLDALPDQALEERAGLRSSQSR